MTVREQFPRRTRPEFDHRIDPFGKRTSRPDALGRKDLAQVLASHLLADDTGVVGLYGSWGAGKTFVLDLTIDLLFDRPTGETLPVRPLVCHFQPWKYESDESLVPGLIRALETLPEQFVGPGLNPQFDEPVRKKLEAIGERLRTVVRVALGMAKELPVGVLAKAGIIGTEMLLGDSGDQKSDLLRESATEKVREVMEELVRELRCAAARAEDQAEEDFRVVVIIDDLDRCAPDRMVGMLNWLKVHLNVPGCSYLLALDHGAASRAIVGQYKDYLGDASDITYGYRYLEKIVDQEVELSASGLVERMAAETVDGQQTVNAIIESVLGGQGARLKEIDMLVGLPTLQSPRTMLKLIARFTSTLKQVRAREEEKRTGKYPGEEQLPADYPFWLLLLTAMYYRLSPKVIDEFCLDQGELCSREQPSLRENNHGDTALEEFRRFLWALGPEGEAPTQSLPGRQARRQLYAAVRHG